jgi:hypothetical protein
VPSQLLALQCLTADLAQAIASVHRAADALRLVPGLQHEQPTPLELLLVSVLPPAAQQDSQPAAQQDFVCSC